MNSNACSRMIFVFVVICRWDCINWFAASPVAHWNLSSWCHAAQRLDCSPGWVGAVHSWASSPQLSAGLGCRGTVSRRACSSRVRRPGLRQANRLWEVVERCTSRGVKSCRSSGAGSGGVGSEDAGAKAGLQAALERAKPPAPEVKIHQGWKEFCPLWRVTRDQKSML